MTSHLKFTNTQTQHLSGSQGFELNFGGQKFQHHLKIHAKFDDNSSCYNMSYIFICHLNFSWQNISAVSIFDMQSRFSAVLSEISIKCGQIVNFLFSFVIWGIQNPVIRQKIKIENLAVRKAYPNMISVPIFRSILITTRTGKVFTD